MTVTYGAQGAGNTQTGTVAINWVAGATAGQYVLAAVASGSTPNTAVTEGEPQLVSLAQAFNTDGTYGAGTGPRRACVFGGEVDGTQTGSVSFTNGGGGSDPIGGIMYRYTKTLDDWVVAAYTADYSAGDAANASFTWPDVALAAGDQLFVCLAGPDSSGAVSGYSWAASGITFGATTERVDVGQTAGNDVRIATATSSVATGSGTQDVTLSITEDESLGAVLVVLRDAAAGGAEVPVGAATETDTAGTVTPSAGGVTTAVATATETDTAGGITPAPGPVTAGIGTGLEVDTAGTVTPTAGGTAAPVATAAEVDTAGAITPAPGAVAVPIGTAIDTSAAGAITPTPGPVTVTVATATEADTAGTVTPGSGAVVPIGTAVDTSTAGTVTPTAGPVATPIGTAVEVDTAGTVTPVDPDAVDGPARFTSTARPAAAITATAGPAASFVTTIAEEVTFRG